MKSQLICLVFAIFAFGCTTNEPKTITPNLIGKIYFGSSISDGYVGNGYKFTSTTDILYYRVWYDLPVIVGTTVIIKGGYKITGTKTLKYNLSYPKIIIYDSSELSGNFIDSTMVDFPSTKINMTTVNHGSELSDFILNNL